MNSAQIKSFFALIFAVAIATVFVLGLQYLIFSQPVIPFNIKPNDLEDWIGSVFWPTAGIIYGLGIFFLLIWIFKAATGKYVNAKRSLSNGVFWWLLLIIYLVLALVTPIIVSFFAGWLDGDKSIEALLWLVSLFIPLDVIFLYWLPTAIATPRSLRYVPPLAMTLRKLYGG